MKSGMSALFQPRLPLPPSSLPFAFPIRTHSLTHTMSGITEVNQIAAASAGADAATTIIIADAFGLMHVLQVYTSAMVCHTSVLRRRLAD
jgi:pyruvate/oxaloacetate carboxyltransferase